MKTYQFRYSLYVTVQAPSMEAAELLASNIAFNTVSEGELDHESPDEQHQVKFCPECGDSVCDYGDDTCEFCGHVGLTEEREEPTNAN
jgi:hypothetical protein